MKYFLLAGEPSGDALGGNLIRSIKAIDPDAEFYGVGGAQMIDAGLTSLLSLDELTVLGIWEAVMRYPQLRKIAFALVDEVEKIQPDAVITIDFPDFNFAFANLVKKRKAIKTRLIHYVAPTVWAWRPGRAKKVAKFLDAMICLFSFEPAYFKKYKLRSVAVGHPITENTVTDDMGAEFRKEREIPADATVVGLFFGSRDTEIANVGPVIAETAQYLEENNPNLHFVIPTLPALEYDVLQKMQGIKSPVYVSTKYDHKWGAIKSCDVAVAVSGTVALEIAYAGIPHVVLYKTSASTFYLARMLVKAKFIHLANIILDKAAIPEFIQGRCKSERVAPAVENLISNKKEREKQIAAFPSVRKALGDDNKENPSDKAARFIVTALRPPQKKKTAKPAE